MMNQKFKIDETVYTVDSKSWKLVKFKIGAIKKHANGDLIYSKGDEYDKFYGQKILAKNKNDLLKIAKDQYAHYIGKIDKNYKKVVKAINSVKK